MKNGLSYRCIVDRRDIFISEKVRQKHGDGEEARIEPMIMSMSVGISGRALAFIYTGMKHRHLYDEQQANNAKCEPETLLVPPS